MVDFEIKRDTESLAERRAAQKQHQLVKKIILATALAAVVLVGGIVISQMRRATIDGPPPRSPVASQGASKPAPSVEQSPSGAPDKSEQTTASEPPAPTTQLVDDDGQTMWVSPTQGAPLELVHLPAESQLVLVLRPSELQATGEMDQIATALGPSGSAGVDWLERAAGRRWDSIEQVVVAMHMRPDYSPEFVLVVTPVGPKGNPNTLPGFDVWMPENVEYYVVASPTVLADLKDLPPRATLRRDFEELLERSDQDRHITLLMTNSLVGSPTVPLWQGPWARLRSSVFDWLPDQTQAFSLSLHWSETFFAEMRLVASLDQRPEKFAERLQQSLADWPARTEETVTSLSLQPYGRKVIARLPAMLREVTRYVRAGRDERYALLRVYLPQPAGHNLLAAGELLLAEQFAGPPQGAMPLADASPPKTLAERLQTPTSLSFARDTLEAALQALAEDTGMEIEVVGADLQLDGITKNQSFGLDLHERPAAEILVEILRQANPDKTATGPADPKQKLVYVVVNSPDGSQTIKVTTRSQAEKRGETLPRVFLQ